MQEEVEVETNAHDKLRTGVLWWQLSTTVQFAFFFILFKSLGAIDKFEHAIIFWGAYSFFTLYHIIFYIFWWFVITGNNQKLLDKENECKQTVMRV